MGASAPQNLRRNEILRRYNILDTPPEKEFDDITQLAAKICQVPLAVISLVDECRQWFKSRVGIEAAETSLDQSICAHTILQTEPLIIPDTLRDPRFIDHPAVIDVPHLRFYAGVPLLNPEGFALGTLCVGDYKPRELSELQLETLLVLGRQVLGQLELRRSVAELQRSVAMRQEVTNALRESEERFRGAFDEAPIGMALTDTNGEFMLINSALCEILGYSDPELRRLHLRDLVHPDDLAHETALRDEALEKQLDAFQVEQRYIHRDGHIVWGLLAVSLVWDAQGNLKYYIIQIQDISDRRRMQAEIAASRDEALRTAEEKARFLANMSHEIRTPLNGIIGMTGFLRDTELTPRQREFTNVVLSSADALLTLINDILDFSKIEAGKLNLERTSFDLHGVIEGAAELLAEPAQRNGVELVVRIDAQVPTALIGDPGRLRQIITNLLSNAVKFTEQGEVVLHVTPETNTIEDRTQLRFTVRDTGIGISPEGQKQLFQAFSQAEDSTTRKYGGTGLGLTICRQLVEIMGGEIGVESAPGKGSTFWFVLPVEIQEADRDSISSPTEIGLIKTTRLKPGPALYEDWLNQRILVVDDNASARTALLEQLTALGVRVEAVSNSAAALASIYRAITSNDAFRLVLLDGQMPGMDGLMLARAIRAEPSLARTPLVLMMNLGNWDTAETAQLRIASCLTKPIKRSALIETLNSISRGDNSCAASTPSLSASMPKEVQGSNIDFGIPLLEPMDTAHLTALPSVDVLRRNDSSVPVSDGDVSYRYSTNHESLIRTNVEPVVGSDEDATDEHTDGHKRRILIAEDNPVNQRVALLQLENLGYIGEAVRNGEEALEKLAENEYDVVLMDCQMPKMDGFKTASEYRRREAVATPDRHLPIIALTANVVDGVHEKCLAAGMDDYLRKPVQLEEMAATLQRWCESDSQKAGPVLSESASELDIMPVLDVDTWHTLYRLIVATRSAQMSPESNDRSRLTDIADKFFDNALRRINTLSKTLQNREKQVALRLAHGLRGSCASFGAHRMAKLCGLLEEHVRTGAYEEALLIPPQLELELEKVRLALPEIIARMVQK